MTALEKDGFTAWPDDFAERYRELGHWQDETLGGLLARLAATHGNRTAITDQNGTTSYAALNEQADRLAGGLQGLGIRRGDPVLVQLPNGAAFVAVSFALFRLGALPIFALPAQRLHDLDALSRLAQPVAYICQSSFMGFDYRAMAEELQSRNDCLRHIIIDGDHGTHIDLSTLEGRFDPLNPPVPTDIACLLLSGGTTGTPKLIPRTHADYAYNARMAAQTCGVDANSVYLAVLPAAHNFTLSCPGILGTLTNGGRVVMSQSPSPDEAFPLIEAEGVTITALVPALVPLWLQQREWDSSDLSSLKLLQVGGARLDPVTAEKVTPLLGCGLQQVFGMAEGLICMTRPDDPVEVAINTQGRPISADDDLRIVDQDGNDLPDGAVGELLVRGPYTIRGYFRAATHNLTAFTGEGYYRSGDLVRRRADGNLVVEGRAKEQINRAGEKIAAAEIEDLLREYPGVADAVVMGVPDPILGERSCAVLIVNGERPTLAQLRDALRARDLAQFKLPDELRFASSWPLTPIGKIDRRKLAHITAPATAKQQAFLERTVSLDTDPLAVAAALAATAGAENATVYEHQGEFSVGLGELARIQLNGEKLTLQQKDDRRDWPASDAIDLLETVLQDIAVQGWRAYGMAEFELTRHFHDLPLQDDSRPLLILSVPRAEYRLRADTAVLRALDEDELQRMARILEQVQASVRQPGSQKTKPTDILAGAEDYKHSVARGVAEIHAGDYQKVILSRPVPLPFPLDMTATYVAGRRANDPARSFLVLRQDFQAAGFSPETVVEVTSDGVVATQPLAGTRALLGEPMADMALGRELLSDPKEIAEHAVSVKLAHEELMPICQPDSIGLSYFMDIIHRGSVQHLASRLGGRLTGDTNRWHAFRALFPAVTASGIPKREAVDAIGRHEQGPRGLYSGAVLIADQDGLLDAALVLRSAYQQDGQAWLRAGAGIVALSDPERELTETCEKLASVARNLVPAIPVDAAHDPAPAQAAAEETTATEPAE
ncbi:salicylate synthase [Paracoccus caeni]|uniref:Salicylate synthase n=1 Tax=Paracoccus caeni TaxID=657651 RepID=A0A934SHD2_9RHOB|nr:salicylate synthase [Paracoccus caeni]MBK4217872.1 salicylate synthase [Paracoccus caeni]